MRHRGLASSCSTLIGTLAVLLTMPVVALAQTQEPPAREPARNADFRFGRPKAAISVRGGWNIASAGSERTRRAQRQELRLPHALTQTCCSWHECLRTPARFIRAR